MTGNELFKLFAVILLSRSHDLNRTHDQTRRTEAALDGRLLNECLLDRRKLAVWPL